LFARGVLGWWGGGHRGLGLHRARAAAAGLRVAAVHPAGATPVVELATV
jgi:hypothetical protein